MNTIKNVTSQIAMPIMLILFLVIAIIIIYVSYTLYRYYEKINLTEPKLLCKIQNAENPMDFDDKQIKLPEFNGGIEATLNYWIYIKDWDKIDNKKKDIF